jgi:hypothetical protein
VTGRGAGIDSLADDQDGLVSVPYEVVHRTATDMESLKLQS